MKLDSSLQLVAVFVFTSSFLLAQSGQANNSSSKGEKEAEELRATDAWTALASELSSAASKEKEKKLSKPADRTSIEQLAHADTASALLKKADQLQDFLAKYPKSDKANEAKYLQLRLITEAVRKGDTSRRDQVAAAVDAYRKDKKVDINDRYRVAAGWERLFVASAKMDENRFFADTESVEKRLIAEFPQVPHSYEAILRLAEKSQNKDAIRLATLIADSKTAPDVFVAKAQAVIKRNGLLGSKITDILAKHFGQIAGAGAPSTKQIIVYFWSCKSPSSIKLARRLFDAAEVGTVIVGINLDNDDMTARMVAGQQSLKGLLFFDPRGLAAPVAQSLGITGVPQIFIADKDGVITDVSGQLTIEAAARKEGEGK